MFRKLQKKKSPDVRNYEIRPKSKLYIENYKNSPKSKFLTRF